MQRCAVACELLRAGCQERVGPPALGGWCRRMGAWQPHGASSCAVQYSTLLPMQARAFITAVSRQGGKGPGYNHKPTGPVEHLQALNGGVRIGLGETGGLTHRLEQAARPFLANPTHTHAEPIQAACVTFSL